MTMRKLTRSLLYIATICALWQVVSWAQAPVTLSGANSIRIQDGSGNALTSLSLGAQRAVTVAIMDGSGNQITSFSGSGGTSSNFGSATPSAGTAAGGNDGTNMQAFRVVDADTGAGTFYTMAVNSVFRTSGTPVEAGTSSNPWNVVFASTQSVNVAQLAGTTTAVNNGTASAGTLRVTLASDGTGVIDKIVTSIVPGTAATNLGKAEDAAHTTGDTGIAMLTRRIDSPASSAGTSGDYATLDTDANGRVYTNPFPGSPAAGTYIPVRLTDGSSFLTPSVDPAHDAAMVIGTQTGPAIMLRASAAAPSDVSADNDAVHAWALRNGSLVIQPAYSGTLAVNDPCQTATKSTATGSLTARAVVISAASSKKNHICSWGVVVQGTAETVSLVEGTGTTCQTSTAAIVGSTTAANGLAFAANGGLTQGDGGWTVVRGTGTNVDSCLVPSGSNRFTYWITYVQQ